MALLDRGQGRNSVVLELPEGDVPIDKLTALDLSNQGEVSMLFGGAEMFYQTQDVSVEDIARGLDL